MKTTNNSRRSVYYAGLPVDRIVKKGTSISFYSFGWELGTVNVFQEELKPGLVQTFNPEEL